MEDDGERVGRRHAREKEQGGKGRLAELSSIRDCSSGLGSHTCLYRNIHNIDISLQDNKSFLILLKFKFILFNLKYHVLCLNWLSLLLCIP